MPRRSTLAPTFFAKSMGRLSTPRRAARRRGRRGPWARPVRGSSRRVRRAKSGSFPGLRPTATISSSNSSRPREMTSSGNGKVTGSKLPGKSATCRRGGCEREETGRRDDVLRSAWVHRSERPLPPLPPPLTPLTPPSLDRSGITTALPGDRTEHASRALPLRQNKAAPSLDNAPLEERSAGKPTRRRVLRSGRSSLATPIPTPAESTNQPTAPCTRARKSRRRQPQTQNFYRPNEPSTCRCYLPAAA